MSDYTCFHDIDYLPIWADYSWVDVPTPIVWYGAENRPIRVGNNPDGPRLAPSFSGVPFWFPTVSFGK